jgi:putative hemolysin
MQQTQVMYQSTPNFTKLSSLYNLGDLKAGSLEVFIANRPEDIAAAQELRYRVFFEEMGAPAVGEIARTKRDFDMFDQVCDHLLVVEHQLDGSYLVVGTYRLLRRDAMKAVGRFYTDGEYDISLIKNYSGEIMEVGRSCVASEYRNRAVLQLLWRGIGAYVAKFEIKLLFGCASFHGIDPKAHSLPLSYLHHYHLAPPELRARALPDRYVEMNLMPKDQIDVKKAFSMLPALIKGYLRLNGYVGAGAVVDPEYNTTDVNIVVNTDLITEKYAQRYSKDYLGKDTN